MRIGNESTDRGRVFLVDGDGTVEARWDNVLDQEALVAELEALGDG